jgi:hypothetical protein
MLCLYVCLFLKFVFDSLILVLQQTKIHSSVVTEVNSCAGQKVCVFIHKNLMPCWDSLTMQCVAQSLYWLNYLSTLYMLWLWCCDPLWVMASSFLRFLNHT